MSRWIRSLAILAGIVLVPTLALTQDTPSGQDTGRRRGNFDPAQRMTNIKEQMAVSDDEWNALKPKIEKVLDAQRDARPMGRMGGPGGPGGGGAAANQPDSKVAQAQRDLRTALESKDTPAAEITKKLAAYREARDKARAELEAAQKALKAQVKPRQEAVLVVNGVLE